MACYYESGGLVGNDRREERMKEIKDKEKYSCCIEEVKRKYFKKITEE